MTRLHPARRWTVAMLAIALGGAASVYAADPAEQAATPAAEEPQVAERYQRAVGRAWSLAESGPPTMTCASVVGHAARDLGEYAPGEVAYQEALAAIDACYVQVMARYLGLGMDAVEAGRGSCTDPVIAMSIHRNALGPTIARSGDPAEYDLRLAALVGERIRAACPETADEILAEG